MAVVLVLGVLAGILSGLFGIAGGTLLVPGLMILTGSPQIPAIATSLAGNILPVGVLGVRHYWKRGFISLRAVVPLTVFLALGSWVGSNLALQLPDFWHKITYGVFMVGLSLRFLIYVAPVGDDNVFPSFPLWGMGLAGMTAGIFSGLFGIGGGAIIVPILVEFFRFSQTQASATSLAALLLPFSLPGVLTYHQSGQVNWVYAGILALGLFLGVVMGARIHTSSSTASVRWLYGAYLGLIGLGFLASTFLG